MNTNYPPLCDLQIRWNNLQSALIASDTDACLIASNVNIYYLTGLVFNGYVYVPRQGKVIYFVRRPADSMGEPAFESSGFEIVPIRKLEDIPSIIETKGFGQPNKIAVETDFLTYNDVVRIKAAFPAELVNATALLRTLRMIKTDWEIEQLRKSATAHVGVYEKIPSLYRRGMRDIDLQIEIEHLMRLSGSIGLFRAFGSNMEIHMGTVLAGDNAEAPAPADFALGGAGLHPSLPIGASGAMIEPGTTVTIDMSGNYTAYISDITRVFSLGKLPQQALDAHRCSIEMHNYFRTLKAGASCAEIYNVSLEMAEKAGLKDFFMGTKQQAKFVGHGLGIEINEMPVMMPRSKDILQTGMAIAYEPKFVIPNVGAVGIENTYLVKESEVENLTPMQEDIIPLE